MGPGVRRGGLAEPELLVEFHRSTDIGGLEADLVEVSEHARRRRPMPRCCRGRRLPGVGRAPQSFLPGNGAQSTPKETVRARNGRSTPGHTGTAARPPA